MSTQQIYNKYVSIGKIDAANFEVHELDEALEKGRQKHCLDRSLAHFKAKTWRKLCEGSYAGKTHIGTYKFIADRTANNKRATAEHNRRVEAARRQREHDALVAQAARDREEAERIRLAMEAQAARDREEAERRRLAMEAQLRETQRVVAEHRQQLERLNNENGSYRQTIDRLVAQITELNRQKADDIVAKRDLNAKMETLTAQLVAANYKNEELVRALVEVNQRLTAIERNANVHNGQILELVREQTRFNGLMEENNRNIARVVSVIQANGG